ncbi:MAG: DnaJ domain-containing protein [Rhodoferax sp.]|jgi:curved DNA-binding protein CbpA|nr:DnaJ domain-containing protein [Rhodoferax sp.]
MAGNFYQILEANEAASQDTIQSLFEQKCKLLEPELEQGSATAKEQLWFLKQAYETLSNPGKRAAYDDSLKPKAMANIQAATIRTKPEGLSWKLNALLIALLASGLIGFGLHLGRANKQDDHTAQILQTNRGADNDATRAGTERVLVDGMIKNDSKIIDRSAELGNRSLNIQQDAENRHRQELEYRANAGSQILDMERRSQEQQIAMQERQLQDARRLEEERNANREKQYWACMNSALDKVSSADAGARCSGYR